MIGRRRIGAVLAACLAIILPGALEAGERGTARQAQQLVEQAIELYDARGLRAFHTISRDPSFFPKDLYVFVLDRIGSVAATGFAPHMVGANVLNARDRNGVWYVRELLGRATPEGVWVDYIHIDPLLLEPAPKSTWAVRHDGFVFACGIYAGEISI